MSTTSLGFSSSFTSQPGDQANNLLFLNSGQLIATLDTQDFFLTSNLSTYYVQLYLLLFFSDHNLIPVLCPTKETVLWAFGIVFQLCRNSWECIPLIFLGMNIVSRPETLLCVLSSLQKWLSGMQPHSPLTSSAPYAKSLTSITFALRDRHSQVLESLHLRQWQDISFSSWVRCILQLIRTQPAMKNVSILLTVLSVSDI